MGHGCSRRAIVGLALRFTAMMRAGLQSSRGFGRQPMAQSVARARSWCDSRAKAYLLSVRQIRMPSLPEHLHTFALAHWLCAHGTRRRLTLTLKLPCSRLINGDPL